MSGINSRLLERDKHTSRRVSSPLLSSPGTTVAQPACTHGCTAARQTMLAQFSAASGLVGVKFSGWQCAIVVPASDASGAVLTS